MDQDTFKGIKENKIQLHCSYKILKLNSYSLVFSLGKQNRVSLGQAPCPRHERTAGIGSGTSFKSQS